MSQLLTMMDIKLPDGLVVNLPAKYFGALPPQTDRKAIHKGLIFYADVILKDAHTMALQDMESDAANEIAASASVIKSRLDDIVVFLAEMHKHKDKTLKTSIH